jgi:Leucine-rich repeat (LRR) protein
MMSSLPSSFGVLTCCEILQLDNNRLKFLPTSIGDLGRLRILSITRNKCTKLPDTFKNLRNLEKFYCDQNNLTSLPELPINLISISANKNLIGPMLPDSITNLKALRFCDVADNKLVQLSHTMGRLLRLTRFNIGNNKISVSSFSYSHPIVVHTYYCNT